jgi:hypothetical protein
MAITARTHLFSAAAFFIPYLLALYHMNQKLEVYQAAGPGQLVAWTLLLFVVCLLFAIWPDIESNSFSRSFFLTVFCVVDVALIAAQHYETAAYLGLCALLPFLSRWRWVRSLWAMVLVPLPLALLPYFLFPEAPLAGLPFFGAAVVGYASHLLLDRLSRLRSRS